MGQRGFKVGGGSVKSIQHLRIDFNNWRMDIPISPVNKENCLVLFSHGSYTNVSLVSAFKIWLSSDTNLFLERPSLDSYTIHLNVAVVEFENIKSSQEGTIQLDNSQFTREVDISPVDMSKSIIFGSFAGSSSNLSHGYQNVGFSFINSSRIKIEQRIGSPGPLVYYKILEFDF